MGWVVCPGQRFIHTQFCWSRTTGKETAHEQSCYWKGPQSRESPHHHCTWVSMETWTMAATGTATVLIQIWMRKREKWKGVWAVLHLLLPLEVWEQLAVFSHASQSPRPPQVLPALPAQALSRVPVCALLKMTHLTARRMRKAPHCCSKAAWPPTILCSRLLNPLWDPHGTPLWPRLWQCPVPKVGITTTVLTASHRRGKSIPVHSPKPLKIWLRGNGF